MCCAALEIVTKECPELVENAKTLEEKYLNLFQLFANCHDKYNSSLPMNDDQIKTLGNFMLYYSNICIIIVLKFDEKKELVTYVKAKVLQTNFITVCIVNT